MNIHMPATGTNATRITTSVRWMGAAQVPKGVGGRGEQATWGVFVSTTLTRTSVHAARHGERGMCVRVAKDRVTCVATPTCRYCAAP